jgi:uncharacterized protein YcbK (DUF882 family)
MPALTLHPRGPSKNFTWPEVTRGHGRAPIAVRRRAITHAKNLERLRAAINMARRRHGLKPTGIHILSWWRPEWYNRKIGGARYSRHIQGDATDISLQEVNRLMPWRGGNREFDALANRIFAHGGFGQYPGGSRHVDSRGYKARWTSF